MDSIVNQLNEIRHKGLYRSTRVISGKQGTTVGIDGKEVLLLCSNNYLGLADHPVIVEASAQAVLNYGASSGASRLVSGTMKLHELLESLLADFKCTKSALVFNSGYAANTGIIPALAGRGDTIYSDRLNHASIVDGAILSGARLIRYPHNDISTLENLLKKHQVAGRTLIVTDGVFSMDGDCAGLTALAALKSRFNALLMVDDAHGSGVLGENGRGSAELHGVEDQIDIKMGTLGKAFGSYGAYCAVNNEVRELLINRARSFIFSTSLPPAVLAASLAAVSIVRSPEGLKLRQALLSNAEYFRSQLIQAGFAIPYGTTQIVPIVTGTTELTMEFSRCLLDNGIFVQGIRPPTVPAGGCRLRCTLMATHTREQLDYALEQIVSIGRGLGVI